MRLIFIRHAEPDYEHDSLTEKGWREAKLLAVRTKSWAGSMISMFPRLGRQRRIPRPLRSRRNGRRRRSWTGCTNFRARCRTEPAARASAGI